MKLSIVTVCYNAADTIVRCMESVYNLNGKNYEYIIIDGASTDHTLSIINRYVERLEKKGITVTVISEKDSGIYNAMNKAVVLAKGEWIIFMNADDCFADSGVIDQCIQDHAEYYDVIYGDVIVRFNDELKFQNADPLEILKSGYEMPFCHQSTFTKTALMKEYKFNEKYRIIADIDLYLRLYVDERKFKHIPCYVSVFSNDGISQTNRIRSINEGKLLLREHNLLTIRSRLILNGYVFWYLAKKSLPKALCDSIRNLINSFRRK